jgi:hypothetical protein
MGLGQSPLGPDDLKSSTGPNFIRLFKELGGQNSFHNTLRRESGGIGTQPSVITLPNGCGCRKREEM